MCVCFFSPGLLIFNLLNFELLSFLSLEKKNFISNNPIFRLNFGTDAQPSIPVRVTRVTHSLWFLGRALVDPRDGRNPVKMQPTPLRGQYKTTTGWKHFPNFFFCAQSCSAVFYSLNILILLNTLCAGFSRVPALASCVFSGRITRLTA